MLERGEFYWGRDGKSTAPRVKKFLGEAKPVIPRSVWGFDDAGHTQQSMLEVKALFVIPFDTPKPEKLIERIFRIATVPGDIILDSFLGSGTTAAVAQKIGRQFIGIEMGEHAETYCVPRIRKVIDGEQGGISKIINWQGGGGFRFYRLGSPVFDETGDICRDIRFPVLAAHIWFSETSTPWNGNANTPFLGFHDGRAYALLYNGVLGDKSVGGGNVLTRFTLRAI